MKIFQNAAEQLKKEFQSFINYLDTNEVILSGRTERIGKKDCFALNQQFQIVREQYQNGARTQENYGVIDYFYFFSIWSGVLQITKKKGKGLILQKTERYETFALMTSMEQYVLMLSVWLAEYDKITEVSYSDFQAFRILEQMENGNAGVILSHPYKSNQFTWGYQYFTGIRMFALFHLLEIQWLEDGEVVEWNKFRIKELYQTQEAEALKELLEQRKEEIDFFENIEDVLSIFKNSKEGKTTIPVEKLTDFLRNPVESGQKTIVFKIKVDSCTRTIKMGDQYTLEDLHYLIQESVKFEDDHLYYFQIGFCTSQRTYYAPECEEESLNADTVILAELDLYEGRKILYLFDFGDSWNFQITVAKILPGHMEECEIILTDEEPPEQYEYWE